MDRYFNNGSTQVFMMTPSRIGGGDFSHATTIHEEIPTKMMLLDEEEQHQQQELYCQQFEKNCSVHKEWSSCCLDSSEEEAVYSLHNDDDDDKPTTNNNNNANINYCNENSPYDRDDSATFSNASYMMEEGNDEVGDECFAFDEEIRKQLEIRAGLMDDIDTSRAMMTESYNLLRLLQQAQQQQQQQRV
eukprot:m.13004 g.13004  ORF g.13004 m.13004 type:complete len:189 (+) comp4093_c0_seq1:314-880(+)